MPGLSRAITVDIADVDQAALVTVAGEVDLATADQLAAAARDLPAGRTPVVLDLERVSFMDSSGMRSLLEFSRSVGEAGRQLGLLRPSAAVTRLLDLVDLRARFTEIDDVEDASLRALAQQPPADVASGRMWSAGPPPSAEAGA